MLVVHLGQVVRKITEIVPCAQLDVLAHVAVQAHQGAGAAVLGVRQIELARFDQRIPAVQDVVIGPQDVQTSVAAEILRVFPVLVGGR